MSWRYILFIAFILSIFIYIWSSNNRWTLYYYPDENNIPRANKAQNYIVGEYESFESCEDEGVFMIRRHEGRGDYQCGLNCKFNEEYRLVVCEDA